MKHVFLIILLLINITLSGKGLGPSFNPDSWKRVSPSGCGISLELPGPVTKLDLPTPAEMKSEVRYFQMHAYQGEGLALFIIHCSGTTVFSPKAFAEGVVKGVFNVANITDLKYSTEPSTASKAPIKGTYNLNSVVLEMDGVVEVKGTHTWLVLGIYQHGHEIGVAITQRALKSVRFDEKACPDLIENVVRLKTSDMDTSHLNVLRITVARGMGETSQ